MFDIQHPANSLTELIGYLKGEHGRQFVYRGQISDYGKLFPSVFRDITSSKFDDFFIYAPKEDADRIQVLKATLIFFLMETFGGLVGNYLAQQYLAKSGCIDVTEDLEVAAFFSKMRYPKYNEMFVDEQKLGVIYRFDTNKFSGNIVPKNRRQNENGIANETYENENNFNELKTNDFDLKLDFSDELKHYIVHDNVTTYSDMEPLLNEYEVDNTDLFAEYYEPSTNYFARPKAQMGGFIQPKYFCQYHPDNPRSKHLGDAVGIEDIYDKYSMEKFYFRHTPVNLKLSREDIWPAVVEDPMLMKLSWLVAQSKDSGKIEPEIKIHDLIDFGYEGNMPVAFFDI